MSEEEKLLRITNPKEYAELIDFRAPVGISEYTKDSLPNDSNYWGLWHCNKCNNNWVSTIRHRIYENDYGCRICKNNSEDNITIKIIYDELFTNYCGVTTKKEIVYNRKSGIISVMEIHNDNYNIDSFAPYYHFETDNFEHNMLIYSEPQIAKYWNNYKNIPVDKISILSDDSIELDWKCPKCNKTFKDTLARMRRNLNEPCPYCSGKIPTDSNSLKTTHPNIADEIVESMSVKKIDDYSADSKIGAVFKCNSCGIYYRKRIIDRISTPCEYCNNGMTKEKSNIIYDGFSHLNPHTEFLDPKMKKYERYTCNICGHEQIVEVKSVFEGNFECNVCNQKEVMIGYNSLDITTPELEEEYSNKNKTKFNEIGYWQNKNILWKCKKCSGTYKLPIHDKIKKGIRACPYCNNIKPLPGFNTLEITNPELIEEYSNKNITKLNEIGYWQNKSLYWKCKICSGTYNLSIQDKIENGTSECPYCNNIKPLPGFNTLEITNPGNYINNYLLLNPNEILPNNAKNVWWNCQKCNNNYLISTKNKLLNNKRKISSCNFCKGKRYKQFHFLNY